MGSTRITLLTICLVISATLVESKIILPHKLRYLENMLNSEVVAKAARIRQQMEANPNAPEADKNWLMSLGKYQPEEKLTRPAYPFNPYNQRGPTNFN